MAAWNVTICSSASSVLKMNNKNRVDQVLGMVPSPQVSPNTIRGGEALYMEHGGGSGGSPKRQYYTAFTEAMADEEVMMMEEEEMGGVMVKKRRLTMEQVRYLESSFDSENKLEPERKAHIASKLGLQPRQVAVWFQNRRARSKSKQVERDFNALKADYRAILLENEKLQAEVDRLTAQLREGSVPQEGGLTAVATEVKDVKTSGSNECSSNCGSGGVKVEAEAEAEASTATGEEGRGNDLGDGEEQSSPYTILTDVNVNVNVSASVLAAATGLPAAAAAAAAAVRAKVAVVESAASYEALPWEEMHLLTNCVQQAQYAQHLFDLYSDTLHSYDNSLLDDPW